MELLPHSSSYNPNMDTLNDALERRGYKFVQEDIYDYKPYIAKLNKLRLGHIIVRFSLSGPRQGGHAAIYGYPKTALDLIHIVESCLNVQFKVSFAGDHPIE